MRIAVKGIAVFSDRGELGGAEAISGLSGRGALSYVLKGASPEAASQFDMDRLEQGGRVIGKRCGTSQNIGSKARKAA